jgi:hypothetical protein
MSINNSKNKDKENIELSAISATTVARTELRAPDSLSYLRFSLRHLMLFVFVCVLVTPIGIAAVQGTTWAVGLICASVGLGMLVILHVVFFAVLRAIASVFYRDDILEKQNQ